MVLETQEFHASRHRRAQFFETCLVLRKLILGRDLKAVEPFEGLMGGESEAPEVRDLLRRKDRSVDFRKRTFLVLETEAVIVDVAVDVVAAIVDVVVDVIVEAAAAVVVQLLPQPQGEFRVVVVVVVGVVLSESVAGLKVVARVGVLMSENVAGVHLDFRGNG